MKKEVCLILLLFLCIAVVYGFDVDFTWSLGDIGIVNFNFEKNINVHFSILSFNWIEKNTGIGLGFALTNQKTAFPFEFIWNPFSTRFGNSLVFGTFGIYNRIGWGAAGKNYYFSTPISDLGFINTIGIRYIFSTAPYGRSKEKRHKKYHYNGTIYADYSTDNTWRIGISIDILFLGTLLLYPIFYITEKPILE